MRVCILFSNIFIAHIHTRLKWIYPDSKLEESIEVLTCLRWCFVVNTQTQIKSQKFNISP